MSPDTSSLKTNRPQNSIQFSIDVFCQAGEAPSLFRSWPLLHCILYFFQISSDACNLLEEQAELILTTALFVASPDFLCPPKRH